MRKSSRRTKVNQHPLALLAAFFAVGILCGSRLALPFAVYATASGALLASALVGLRGERFSMATWCVVLAFLCAGACAARIGRVHDDGKSVARFYDDDRIESGDPVEVVGVIERAPEPAPDGFRLRVRTESLRFDEEEHEAHGRVNLFAPIVNQRSLAAYQNLNLQSGARVRVLTRLRRAEEFRNPGVTSRLELLARQGVDATGTIKSALLIERLGDEAVFLPLASLYAWRVQMLARVSETFDSSTASVLQASLLGDEAFLSRGDAERFRIGGTYHVLVISGMHISVLGATTFFIAGRLTRKRLWQFAASMIVLWGYALAVGAEASVVRAALMFTFVALAPVVGRPTGTLNALGAAALLLLIAKPSDLFSPSFQLTFLSVLAIVVIALPLLGRLREVGEWQPTRATPYPPSCPAWWRVLAETLFWNQQAWEEEMRRSTWNYKIRKDERAHLFERWRVQRLARYVFAAIVVSLSVQIAMLPLLVLYFHRFSLASLVLNIMVGALIAALSVSALFALIVTSISESVAQPFVHITEWLNRLLVHSVDPFVSAGVAGFRLPEYTHFAAGSYALYYLPLALLVVALATWRPLPKAPDAETTRVSLRSVRVAASALVFLCFVILAHPGSRANSAYDSAHPNGRLRVDFLDVGQGDAALVTMPDATTMLIDGGGRRSNNIKPSFAATSDEEIDAESFEPDVRSIGESVVSQYLWWRGLDRVDYVVATHADADHIDGLNDVARNFRVRAALVGRTPARDAEYDKFATTLRDARVPLQVIGAGDTLRFGDVTIEVLHPVHIGEGETLAPSDNNSSIVLRLRYGTSSIIFTGDIEAAGENELTILAANLGEDLAADVVKVAHHGSRTSSTPTFVHRTHPTFVVISVGRQSPYGHPAPEVVARWQQNGAHTLTTGASGTITVSTDGRDLSVNSFVDPME